MPAPAFSKQPVRERGGGFEFHEIGGAFRHVRLQVAAVEAGKFRGLVAVKLVEEFRDGGSIEDGSYLWQRDLKGLFGLCIDYSDSPEGGLTDLALVPSRHAVEFLLKQFGFKTVTFYKPAPEDYEQFVRNHRVIIIAEK